MKRKQGGMALAVSMVVLAVAIMLGVSGVNSNLLEERMSGNYRFYVSALQASEVGVKDMIVYVRDNYGPGSHPDCSVDDTILVDPGEQFFSSSGGLDRYYDTRLVCENNEIVGYSVGRVNGGSEVLSEREIRVVLVPPGESEVQGMLANSDITINGNSTIVGSVHANGVVDVKQLTDATIGSITATGQVITNDKDVVYSTDGVCTTVICASSGVEAKYVPPASLVIVSELGYPDGTTLAQIDADYISMLNAGNAPNTNQLEILPVDGSGECTADLSGSYAYDDGYKQKRFYCPGTLKLSGSFSGAWVMASGNIVHGGSSELGDSAFYGEEKVDTYILAGGSITLNGKDDSYAALHADGDIDQNGTSTLYGSVVSGGSITRDGGINFEAMSSGFIMEPVSGFIAQWYELEVPGS